MPPDAPDDFSDPVDADEERDRTDRSTTGHTTPSRQVLSQSRGKVAARPAAAVLGIPAPTGGLSMADALGTTAWVIAEGYIPSGGTGPEPQMTSHETACILNAGDEDAHVSITVYFADREPAGPYEVTVPARRTRHLRFNELADPEPVPRDTDYASVLSSDAPVVVQHTRLDSRQAELGLLSTMAYPAG